MSMPIVAWSKAVGRGGAGDDCDAASSGAVQCGGRRRARSTSPPAWRRPGTAMEVKHQRRCGLRRIARVMCSRASAVLRRQLGRRVLCATAAGAKSAVCDGSWGEECCVRRQPGRRVRCATAAGAKSAVCDVGAAAWSTTGAPGRPHVGGTPSGRVHGETHKDVGVHPAYGTPRVGASWSGGGDAPHSPSSPLQPGRRGPRGGAPRSGRCGVSAHAATVATAGRRSGAGAAGGPLRGPGTACAAACHVARWCCMLASVRVRVPVLLCCVLRLRRWRRWSRYSLRQRLWPGCERFGGYYGWARAWRGRKPAGEGGWKG